MRSLEQGRESIHHDQRRRRSKLSGVESSWLCASFFLSCGNHPCTNLLISISWLAHHQQGGPDRWTPAGFLFLLCSSARAAARITRIRHNLLWHQVAAGGRIHCVFEAYRKRINHDPFKSGRMTLMERLFKSFWTQLAPEDFPSANFLYFFFKSL